MTKVLFRTFGHLTTITKGKEVETEFEGTTVQDFLDALIDRYGAPMKGVLYPQDKTISALLYILVNGKNIAHLQGSLTMLKDEDIVSILPLTAGG